MKNLNVRPKNLNIKAAISKKKHLDLNTVEIGDDSSIGCQGH
jgi:hypothetical protein